MLKHIEGHHQVCAFVCKACKPLHTLGVEPCLAREANQVRIHLQPADPPLPVSPIRKESAASETHLEHVRSGPEVAPGTTHLGIEIS
jgi:hypothetical protein